MSLLETITRRIQEQLGTGRVPWRKSWATGLPKNLTTGREFRGLNLLVLGAAPFRSPHWLTASEALALGGRVRQGEAPTLILERTGWKSGEAVPDPAASHARAPGPCALLARPVFNREQVEGVQCPADDLPQSPAQRFAVADLMLSVRADPSRIVHAATSGPTYDRRTDTITLPHLSQFETADQYYTDLFMGLIRATSHERRLGRKAHGGGAPESAAFAALVAELGAAFLCGFARLSNAPAKQSLTTTLAEWAQALRQDPGQLARAAGDAKLAADYVRGKLSARTDGNTPARCPDAPKPTTGAVTTATARPARREPTRNPAPTPRQQPTASALSAPA
jgi:antirestriction protein ArdC